MLMLCWFYCIPFAKVFYFALSAIMIVFALFMLKRGMRLSRVGLRQGAFLVIFLSCIKMFVFDLRMLKEKILCGDDAFLPIFECGKRGFMLLEFMGLVVLALSSVVIFHFYRVFLPNTKPKKVRPEDVSLRFWANMSMLAVYAMIVWTLAPWVGYLTVGSVPKLFSTLQWQHFALANFALLLVGFWKSESCDWEFDPKQKIKSIQAAKSWTPRDTLWLNVFLYLITLALSYVAHDLLTGHAPKQG